MCGIVGYIGQRNATTCLLDGLSRLEYRGYDSAGVACVCDERLLIHKRRGRLQRLADELQDGKIVSHLGIGHTRWATHGAPSDENAHPHPDCAGRLAVVHNGIIENFEELREQLAADGHGFASATDSEVLAHLIERELNGSLLESVRRALEHVRGAFALAVVSSAHPDRIVCARHGSPLIVAHCEGEMGAESWLASDIPALLPYTREVLILDDDEVAEITREGFDVEQLRLRQRVRRALFHVEWDVERAEKGGAPHFMLKEIREQPRALADAIAGRVVDGAVVLPEVQLTAERAQSFDRVHLVACGTSYHASLVGRQMLERLADLGAEVEIASEYRYRGPKVNERTLFIAVSQSGETADTLAALGHARAQGAYAVGICNVVGSALARHSDSVVYTHAGPEISVASTKAFTTQLAALYLVALRLGVLRHRLLPSEVAVHIEAIQRLPEQLEATLPAHEAVTAELAERYAERSAFLYMGRGTSYPLALEGALKLKEITYLWAEGYAAGELKHGPIALVSPGVPVVVVVPRDRWHAKTISNMEEVRARGAEVIAVGTEGDGAARSRAAAVIGCPPATELLAPILLAAPLQLFAYHVAVRRGCDVDKPRNLAKSVTVE